MDELHAFRQKYKAKHHANSKDNPDSHKTSHPYMNEYNELVIPFAADKKYHYWNGGMSIKDILRELNAADEVMDQYLVGRRLH